MLVSSKSTNFYYIIDFQRIFTTGQNWLGENFKVIILLSNLQANRFYMVYRQSPLGPIYPSFRAFSGRLKLTVRRHKFNKDSLSTGRGGARILSQLRVERHGMDPPARRLLPPGSKRLCVTCTVMYRLCTNPSSSSDDYFRQVCLHLTQCID